MNFRNKIKFRAWLGVFYTAVGAAIIIAANLIGTDNGAAYSFGAIFAATGLARTVRYVRLLRNPEAMQKRETAENDEMNITVIEKARSLAFSVYLIIGGIMLVSFYIAGNFYAGQITAYIICAFTVIYWICYKIVRMRY